MSAFLIKLLTLKRSQDRGFTLILALSMGLIVMTVATTLVFRASRNDAIASTRTEAGESMSVAEGGVARTLALMTKPENAALLTRNYDPLNSKTGKNYLGADGIPNTGDETTTAIDQWATPITSPCPNSVPSPGSPTLSSLIDIDTIGSEGKYQLLAYRYDDLKQTGTFLVEGKQAVAGQPTSSSYVAVTVAVNSTLPDFPGVVQALEDLSENEHPDLSGRSILGKNGNIYFDPIVSHKTTLNASAARGAANRSDYLDAIDLTTGDAGFTDNIGTILACTLTPSLTNQPPAGVTLQPLGSITSSRSISGNSGRISYYQTSAIFIGDGVTVNVDTTNGPIYLYVQGGVYIWGNAKIRNYRTDSKPARVGDLRIIIDRDQSSAVSVILKDTACIQNAFVYNMTGDVNFWTTGSGCDSGNSSIDGVIWAEDFIHDDQSTAGVTVPDDVSSLSDLITKLNVPTINKLGAIQSWERHQL
jgi:hypothetical protein